MAEFSPSGQIDLPPTTADSLQKGDPRVLDWVTEAIQDGDRYIRQDPSYDKIGPAMEYIIGDQLSAARRQLKYLPQVVINESRKAVQAHVSTLTDLKPLFGWRTLNQAYQRQADLLNQYAVAEWVTTMADISLGNCVKMALVAGTGDLVCDWDPHERYGGANEFSARDPRDTLPIRPGANADSPNRWMGVTLREEHTVNALRGMYPAKARFIRESNDSVLGWVMGRFRQAASRLITPADPLDGLDAAASSARRPRSGTTLLYRTYLRDHTRNLTGKPIAMGIPGSNHAYVVPDGEPLYPRGRLIVSTPDKVCLYDGPNTYWHGLFPVCRLRLWSVPWQFLGIPLFNDLLPVQDAINDTMNDIRLAIRQWLDPDIVYNRNAVSESTMRVLDPQRPGKRIKVNPGFGDAYEKKDGPNPQVIAQALALFETLITKHNDLSGTANLTALLQLRQLPSADTISKYYEALTPEIRQEARMVEVFLRDLSQMTKSNYFQFVSDTKRRLILGNDAITLEDLDKDPGTLIPALEPGKPGYTPELDPALTTADQRAAFFDKQFVFVAAPNSIIALNGTERRLQTLQQATMGYVDFWTFHEVFETPNVGIPPAIPLPPLKPLTPEEQQQIMLQTLEQAAQRMTMAPMMAGGEGGPEGPEGMGGPQVGMGGIAPGPVSLPDGRTFLLDPMSGQVLEIRTPTTIVERLQAQQLLGIGMVANAQGRKATNEAPAKSETKNDKPGGRQTTTTSDK